MTPPSHGALYTNTQPGYLLMTALGAGLLMVLVILVMVDFHWLGIFVAALLALFLYTFSSLTVAVTEEEVSVRFRGGLIGRRLLLRDIASARVVRSPWYYGWGVTPIIGGWLYNVSGWGAVELRLKNGRRCIIGSNDPERLAAIVTAIVS